MSVVKSQSVPKSTVTIRDVAEQAGVSVSTVSRVLNDKDDVSEATYAHVQQVIEQLGYTSSLAARSMRSRRNDVIGVLVTDVSDPFSIDVVQSIGQVLRNSEYDLLVYSGGRGPEGSWERRHVSRLNGSITDGIILVAPSTTDLPTAYPLVTIDPSVMDGTIPGVLSTNRQGALAAMDHLLKLGHRRIGFIGGRPDLVSAQRRQQGYVDALMQAGLAVDPALMKQGDYTRGAAFACAQELLQASEPPTAIFAANDQSALGVLDAARQAGLRVPEDLSVVGFDNTDQSALATPPLTTVDQNVAQMSQIAVEMLLTLIEKTPLPQTVQKVSTHLVPRGSTQAHGA